MDRGHLGWLAGAAVAVVSVVLAVAAPASWWGVTFVAGVLVALLAARRVVPQEYAAGWTRTTTLLTMIALVAGMTYAFEAAPWGPRPRVYGTVIFVAALVGIGAFASPPGGRRIERLAGYRQNEDAHRSALRQDPR